MGEHWEGVVILGAAGKVPNGAIFYTKYLFPQDMYNIPCSILSNI